MDSLLKDQLEQYLCAENDRVEERLQRLRSPQPVNIFKRHYRQQARSMTADAVYGLLKAVVDRHHLPLEIDAGADRIPVIGRHLAWKMYFFPRTYPVRVERRGDLPDRSDELWTPLWDLLAHWETSREAARPLSAKGYRLFQTDPKRTA